MIIQEIKQVLENKTIIGRLRFSEWVESGGKRETNVYHVEVFTPLKSSGNFFVTESILYKKFFIKEEAVKFFNKEFPKVIKRLEKPKKKRVIDERYNYDEIKKERGNK